MKKLKTLIISICMVTAFAVTAFAATGLKISFSDPTASVGEEFSVTMKVNATGGKLGKGNLMLDYDPSYVEFTGGDNAQGGAGSIKITGDSSKGDTEWKYTLKFKALQPGSTSITVKDWEIYDGSSNMGSLDHQGSSSVTINGDPNSSINANLGSLKISPGSLTPAFSPDVTEYTATVGGNCDKIAVSAPTADGKATVVISGNSDLKVGDNIVSCKVTAQDGKTEKIYNITVTKQEGDVDYGDSGRVSVNGKEYDIAESFDESLLPEGFTVTSYNYKGRQVMAGVDQIRGLTIMYLIDDEGSGDFFIYDATSDSWSQYAKIYVTERVITVVPVPAGVEIPEGFSETTLDLDGKKVKGWIWASDTERKYCIVYGMNADGDKNFYRYDLEEKTIQRYFSDPAPVMSISEEEYVDAATRYNELINEYNARGYVIVALAAVSVILLIAFIIILIIGRKNASQNTLRSDRPSRPDRLSGSDRGEGSLRQERPGRNAGKERSDRSDRYDRYERPERRERSDTGRPDRYERSDIGRSDRYERSDRYDRTERRSEPDRYERSDRGSYPDSRTGSRQTRLFEEEDIERSLARQVRNTEEKPSAPADDDFETFDL